jgi:hypothetical protein
LHEEVSGGVEVFGSIEVVKPKMSKRLLLGRWIPFEAKVRGSQD